MLSIVMSILSYYGGDRLILAVSGAQSIKHGDDPELYNVVEEVAIPAGIPRPAIYLIDDRAPNAFATGRDPEHASIAVTMGLREKLTRAELQGVVAHEMSHIRNFDTRLMLLLAVLIGTIVILADLLWQALRWGWSGRSRQRSDRDIGNTAIIQLIVFVGAVVLAAIAPMLAKIIQLAVSRQREYLADASAVELTRYPDGLANALRKIDQGPHALATANRGTAHLYISNPIKIYRDRRASIWLSHPPPTRERIARLEQLTMA
jgi:heat shock protein HtpX